jgi:hypothetical protein
LKLLAPKWKKPESTPSDEKTSPKWKKPETTLEIEIQVQVLLVKIEQ